MRLIEHNVRLQGNNVVLRPVTEEDWDILHKWNNDADVLYYSDGDDTGSHGMKELKVIYRTVSQNAYCFIIEFRGKPVGECWLQKMNLKRIVDKYPEKDCRRIDIMIGERDFWGKGIGTDVIRILTGFGFGTETAELLFGCDIADYNPRSMKAFQKNGYELDAMIKQPLGKKARYCYDLSISRERYKKHES